MKNESKMADKHLFFIRQQKKYSGDQKDEVRSRF